MELPGDFGGSPSQETSLGLPQPDRFEVVEGGGIRRYWNNPSVYIEFVPDKATVYACRNSKVTNYSTEELLAIGTHFVDTSNQVLPGELDPAELIAGATAKIEEAYVQGIHGAGSTTGNQKPFSDIIEKDKL